MAYCSEMNNILGNRWEDWYHSNLYTKGNLALDKQGKRGETAGLPAALKLQKNNKVVAGFQVTSWWLQEILCEWCQSSHLTVSNNAMVFKFLFTKVFPILSNFFTFLIHQITANKQIQWVWGFQGHWCSRSLWQLPLINYPASSLLQRKYQCLTQNMC